MRNRRLTFGRLASIGVLTAVALTAATALTASSATAQTTPPPPQWYVYQGWRGNPGPLNCETRRINWTRHSEARFDGSIQVEGPNDLFMLFEWGRPIYNESSGEIMMDLEARGLRGSPGAFPGIYAVNKQTGGLLKLAQLVGGGGPGQSAQAVVRINPVSLGNPDVFTIVLMFANGGTCTQPWLGEYTFFRQVGQAPPPPVPGPSPVSPPGPAPAPTGTFPGTWGWRATCPSGTYDGFLTFRQPSSSGAFGGTFSTVGGGGDMTEGWISGNRISFIRTVSGRVQRWTGTVIDSAITDGYIEDAVEKCTFMAARR